MGGRTVSDIDRRIASRVQAARKAAGCTQRQIAEALGISYAQQQKYESGQNRISVGALQVLAERLGVPVASFFDAPHAGLDVGEAT